MPLTLADIGGSGLGFYLLCVVALGGVMAIGAMLAIVHAMSRRAWTYAMYLPAIGAVGLLIVAAGYLPLGTLLMCGDPLLMIAAWIPVLAAVVIVACGGIRLVRDLTTDVVRG